MTIVPTKYGKMYVIDSDKVVSRALTLYGEWAVSELDLLAQIISPTMSVLDVGAFIGTHSLAFSEFVGESGKVYSFEPRKEIYAVLSENLAINACNNVTAFNIGLDKEQKTLELPSIDVNELVNFGGLALNSDFHAADSVNYQIDIATIDSLALGKIDVIKLDVEGMEVDVLNGATETITRDRPIVFCECNSLNAGLDVLLFCQARQYNTYGFLAEAFNPDNFNAVTENIFQDAKELALLLIPQEKTAEILGKLTDFALLPINSIEDLVLPLLHKPQYSYEVLANTASASGLGIHFPSPIQEKFNQLIDEQQQAMAVLSLTIAERESDIMTLKQWHSELSKEIEALCASTSWKITKPLRSLSLWLRQFGELVQIYRTHRWMYPGVSGFKRLIGLCIEAIQKDDGKGTRNRSPLHLLRPYLEKEQDLTPTILFDHNGGGGSNIYTRELIETIHANGGIVLRVYYFDGAWFVQWNRSQKKESLFFTTSTEELFELLAVSHSNNIVLNSLYGYPDIKAAAEHIVNLVHTLNASLDFKIHDFYALCPSPHLSDFEDKYCGVPQDVEVCRQCLKRNLSWYHSWYPKENRATDIVEWRKPFADLFAVASTITFFDSSSIDIARQAFDLDDSKIKVIPHLINYFSCDKPVQLAEPLHIATLGMLSHMKGGNVVKTLCEYIDEQGLEVAMTVVGTSYVNTPPRVTIHGKYNPNDLPIIISKRGINVILIPSIIPETFSYTISEAMAMGLPIVAFDIGAQGNRVKQYAFGKVVPLNSSPAVILAATQAALATALGRK
jgi:FkbM family methyltransferase